MTRGTWAHEIGGWLLASRTTAPDEAIQKAALHTFDALACAAGGAGSPPVRAMSRALGVPSGGPCTIFFGEGTAGLQETVLVNGTSVRYLDLNDSYIGDGPGGHPSDNIPVALAVAEASGTPGRQVLATLALGYELYWRLRRAVMKPSRAGWDGVSTSSVVAAGMGGLLMGLPHDALAHAIAIAAASGHTLGQVRRGDISMLKASANALVARHGVLAVLLAAEGMTGPPEVFEGERGLLRSLGLDPTRDVLASLLADDGEWHILRAAIKAYPAIGTAQGLLHGTEVLSRRLGAADVDLTRDVVEVRVRLPDSSATREHLASEERRHPRSRESADHSLPFLVACMLREGSVRPEHFDRELWLDTDVQALMQRVRLLPDAAVSEHAVDCYPAIVEVVLSGGHLEVEEVLRPPGTARDPYGPADVARKMRDVEQVGLDDDEIDAIASACAALHEAPSVDDLMTTVRAGGAGHG